MFLKSIPKLLGVLAMVAAIGLGGSSAAYADFYPFDGGDSSCQQDMNGCHLYHFKLDGHTHDIRFTVYDSACSEHVTSTFTVQRKNSANIWLSTSKPAYFLINFDGRSAFDMEGMEVYHCTGRYNDYAASWFFNNENKCWHLTELRTRGDDCDWS